MYAIAHGGYADTVRESALEVDWKKNPLGAWTHINIMPVFYSQILYQLSCPDSVNTELFRRVWFNQRVYFGEYDPDCSAVLVVLIT